MKKEKMVENLKLEILITSSNQLNQIVDSIQRLSLPNTLQNAEIWLKSRFYIFITNL